MFTNRQIMWMPVFAGRTVSVLLQSSFAERCATYAVPDARMLAEAVWISLEQEGSVPDSFLELSEQSLLPCGFYTGRGGVWLTSEDPRQKVFSRPVVYHSHNADHAQDREWLLRAFGTWASLADALMQR